ncbi:hypothetical protein KDA_23140 [Dictyobacter alpinus]|uniref:Uncharacterized protein n=1 Tax=Dictyobacter alpinus TaxID=2014873 RepID=A0A402B670_9CHLR|nr:hypothetical protein KDA_23140 [Dictyobacter alpinus]
MGKKISLLLLSAIITLFFLLLSGYELTRYFRETVNGDELIASEISGCITAILFILGLSCIILIFKSNNTDL